MVQNLQRYTNTYQADLTFHKVRKLIGKKEGYVQQAIFCIININTCFAAAWPLQLIKKKNYDEAYTPNKARKRHVNFISMFTAKDSLQTTVAFIRCLVYLIIHGKHVDKVYSDEGLEFKSIFKQFCENPMGMIDTHSL